MAEEKSLNANEESNPKRKHKQKHDRPKPWGDPSIDRWKIEKFDPEWNQSGLLEVSTFSTLFPQYREKYLQECCPIVKGALKEYGITYELNLDRFVKLRQYLVCPNSSTLKALEILTGCYILVQILMLKRELAKNPALASENWDKFLPQFKKKNVKQKKFNTKEKKPYTPFSSPQQPSKIDQQLESGEYFLSDKKKLAKQWEERKVKQAEKEPKTYNQDVSNIDKEDVTAMVSLLKKKAKEFRKKKSIDKIDAEKFIAGPSKPSKKKSKSFR
ncbi:hypothetical protein CQW23_02137 [Capsicum baccatum]|uniref:KRR1 small subunit processome component second KH domain-containing protein n=1 Tax=Capsicum baccatum TaxID=33114 RepID=A0A2G2XQK8_CAPBA|nr:hypothetical protein CQW23_02137 [Capsicum baccatum]